MLVSNWHLIVSLEQRRSRRGRPCGLTVMCEADISTLEVRLANRSLSAIEPVCGTPKWKLENSAQRPAPETRPARTAMPKIAGQRLGRASLTRGNVTDSHTLGNNTPATRLSGWDGRVSNS
jgi:hypothetical protein